LGNKGGELMLSSKESIKNILGHIPFTVELYWRIRQQRKPFKSHFSLDALNERLPEIIKDAAEAKNDHAEAGKDIFIFATLHYWIEHATLMGALLTAQGHNVTVGYLPYSNWQKPINRFDLRQQNVYARQVLKQIEPVMSSVSFLNVNKSYLPLNDDILEIVEQVTEYDVQYTLQIEEVDKESDIYKLRLERNTEAARAAIAWFSTNKPDIVIVPNGTIQELGVVYRIAKHLGIETVTYEFGDQRQRIWIAQNTEVMRQETDALWEARKDIPLTDEEFKRVERMFSSRQKAKLWENFARLWQDTPSKGGEKVRSELGLDDRPIALLATNVLGDSLTLGRQVFSRSMEEWISRTVQYFAGRPDVQFVIRIHPGEALTHGPSMSEVVYSIFPTLPENIKMIAPEEKVNTYDIVEIADVGLVYTTTVGLEMAMNGLPVVVAGQTHYRERGFTYDPSSWVQYYKMLGPILDKPQKYRLDQKQVEKAWQYAYRFFFEFPRPFPWHLVRMWDDYKNETVQDALSDKHFAEYEKTFSYLVGEPIDWKSI
jgi:hypothetical protein